MPSDWSRSWEVDRLVSGRLRFEGEVALGAMPRLQDRLYGPAGDADRARANLGFRKELDTDIAQVKVTATVPLRCERCMRRLDWPVDADAVLALIVRPQDADRVPGGFEPVLAEGGRVRLCDLVEEELLLALPLIARHDDPRQCNAQSVAANSPATAEDDIRQKPFAGLAELLQRR